MRSSIASAINSRVLMHAFLLFFVMSDTIPSSWPGIAAVLQVTSVLRFYGKERYCDCVSSGIFPSSIPECCLLCYINYGVFDRVQIKDEII